MARESEGEREIEGGIGEKVRERWIEGKKEREGGGGGGRETESSE